MPHVVIASERDIVCHREVDAEDALEQARMASLEFPMATNVWLYDSLSEAPWHSFLVPASQKKRARSL